jgi:hypothetical protein
MAVVPEGPIAFAWEDPWIYDDPRSHLALLPAGQRG